MESITAIKSGSHDKPEIYNVLAEYLYNVSSNHNYPEKLKKQKKNVDECIDFFDFNSNVDQHYYNIAITKAEFDTALNAMRPSAAAAAGQN